MATTALSRWSLRRRSCASTKRLPATSWRLRCGTGSEVWYRWYHPLQGTTPVPHPGWTTADLARAVGRSRDDKTLRRAVQRLADAGVLYRNGDERRWHPAASLFD